MIRFLIISVCLVLSQLSWSQVWQDTLRLARKSYKAGNYKQALKYYKSATTYAPKGVDLSKETAQSAYRAGDFETAEQAYRKVASGAKTTKEAVDAYTNLGLSQMKGQKYADAENAFKEALRKDPANEKARQLLAEAKRLKKQQEEQQKKQQQQKQQQQQNNQKNKDQDKQPNQSPNQQQQQQKQQQQLRDKQTDRKLDELQRQEMETKKRLNGARGTKGNGKSGKDW